MVKKYCSNCKSHSYSAASQGRWICPTCGKDLSHKPVQLLTEGEPQQYPHIFQLSLIPNKKYNGTNI